MKKTKHSRHFMGIWIECFPAQEQQQDSLFRAHSDMQLPLHMTSLSYEFTEDAKFQENSRYKLMKIQAYTQVKNT